MPPRGSGPSLSLSVPGVEAHETQRPESTRGKAPPLRERAQKYSWMTGSQHLREPRPGMAGLKVISYCNWQAIYEAERCRSGICWGKPTRHPTLGQLSACDCGSIRVARPWLPRSFVTRCRGVESVADFLRRLERVFRVVYGRDKLGTETLGALLYGQLQEGLCYSLVQASAVSGAQTYTELSTAARNEECRLAALERRQQHVQLPPRQSLPPPSYAKNHRCPLNGARVTCEDRSSG